MQRSKRRILSSNEQLGNRGLNSEVIDDERRDFLRKSFLSFLSVPAVTLIGGCSETEEGVFEKLLKIEPPEPGQSNINSLGPLGPADANGIRLPPGFQSRVLARSGEEPVLGSGYLWHDSPDGGAVFPLDDGGWVYTSNSEIFQPRGLAGAGALRFDSGGNLISAYSILDNTSANCAGGPTPWGTWLSCEEYPGGIVWECDPLGGNAAVARPAPGVLVHEGVAVDAGTGYLYLTEDRPSGRFYRFIASANDLQGNPDLTSGTLQVAEVLSGLEGSVVWHDVPDPAATVEATHLQVPQSTPFNGGEGIYIDGQIVYFTTKGDNRVWAYDTADETVFILYDDDLFTDPVLTGVDNITVSMGGDILVAEDGGNMQIVAISPTNKIVPLVEIEGQSDSEVTGPAFSPAGDRLYFSSQRGDLGIFQGPGITYEVRGPFVT